MLFLFLHLLSVYTGVFYFSLGLTVSDITQVELCWPVLSSNRTWKKSKSYFQDLMR